MTKLVSLPEWMSTEFTSERPAIHQNHRAPPMIWASLAAMAALSTAGVIGWVNAFSAIGCARVEDWARGLTLAGARRRLEQSSTPGATDEEVAEVLDALASDARTRIASVRDGLRSILKLLSAAPGTLVVVDDYRLTPPTTKGARGALEARPKVHVNGKQAASGAAGKTRGNGQAREARERVK